LERVGTWEPTQRGNGIWDFGLPLKPGKDWLHTWLLNFPGEGPGGPGLNPGVPLAGGNYSPGRFPG